MSMLLITNSGKNKDFMKLQISFDIADIERALEVAQKVAPFCDIIEVGTLLMLKYGIPAIEQFKEKLPGKPLLADTKILDRGKDSMNALEPAPCEWVTVLGGAHNDVIHAACSTAHNQGKKVMLDLLDAPSPGQAALDSQSLGVDALLFHRPYSDADASVFLEKWDMVKGNTKLPIFVSARINRDTLAPILRLDPYGIIVGKAITEAPDPAAEAEFFYTTCCERPSILR